MKRDAILKPLKSSFLSCEKDAETIIRKLFVDSNPYSEDLKRLLVINTKDCLDRSNQNYSEIIKNTSIKELMEKEYITLTPLLKMEEHEEVKSCIILNFDNFSETDNPEYRDCLIGLDIICHTEYWNIGDYQIRPLKIVGIIDGILNKAKLSGIGELQFIGCGFLPVNEHLSGYSLLYLATHGNDDKVPLKD